MKSTINAPVLELAYRKRWARATSKRLKHSRAHKELLAHLAYRAGYGRVFHQSLSKLAQDCDGSKPHVQRGLALFVAQGLISVKRHGREASEYTVHFGPDPGPKSYQNGTMSYHGDNNELSKQIGKDAQRKLQRIFKGPTVTPPNRDKVLRSASPPPSPPEDGDSDYVLSAPLGLKAFPLKNPPEALKDTDFQESTPSTNGNSSIPRSDLHKLGLCRECRGPLNGSRRLSCEPCWELYKQAQEEHRAEWKGTFPDDGRTVQIGDLR